MPTESVAEIAATIKEFSRGSDHPDLQVYRRDIDSMNFNLWFARRKVFAALGHFYGKDKRILEVGCGFGWDAVGLSLMTDATVVASDILPSMIDGVKECLSTMDKKGKSLKVEAVVGDICKIDLPSESFDGIFSSEAVEHVHSLEDMYDECRRLLKKGGRLVIVNDSNAYNPEFRERNMTMWKERDESWEHANWLAAEVRPVEHAGTRPYGVMREDIIRETDAGLDDGRVKALVAATAGLNRTEINAAVARYRADGSLPVPPELSWCRNPETGEYAERLLEPFAMKRGLEAAGFKVELRGALRRFPLSLLNNTGIPAVTKWVFKHKALFVLVAQKV